MKNFLELDKLRLLEEIEMFESSPESELILEESLSRPLEVRTEILGRL